MSKLGYYNNRKADKGTLWILFLFLGWSYGSLGQIWKQVFYYLTLGGLGLWALYVLFTLNRKIDRYNRGIAIELGLSDDEISMLGL